MEGSGNMYHVPYAPAIQPNPNQQVIIIQTRPSSSQHPRIYEKFPGKLAQCLGLTRIIVGVICIILQSATIGIQATKYYYRDYEIGGYTFSASGIWCGTFFIVAGSFGISSGKVKSFCMIVTNLILSIISVSIFGSVIVFVNLGAIIASANVQKDYDDYEIPSWKQHSNYYSSGYDKGDPPTPFLALFPLLMVAGIIAVICDIITAVICCKHVCCCNQSPAQNPGMDTQNRQVMYVNDPRTIITQGGYPYPINGIPAAVIPPGNATNGPDAPPAYNTATSSNDEKQPL